MALQLFNEDDSTEKTILVVARNGLNGAHITKELRAIVKLRTCLEWMDDKVRNQKCHVWIDALVLQGGPSGCTLPFVDIKTKSLFQYVP